MAIAVLMLAWPRLQASYRYLPVEFAIERYYATREIPTDRLSVLIRFAREAIEHHDHYRFHDGLSVLHLLRAMDVMTPALERRAEYQAAEAEAMESLQRAPAQPSAWARLAMIRWILRDEPENIVTPWKMSVFTGRTETTLLKQRVEIGLAFQQNLDDEALAMLRDQLLLAWRTQPGSLVHALSQRDPNLHVARKLIGDTDPTALADMEAWLAKLH